MAFAEDLAIAAAPSLIGAIGNALGVSQANKQNLRLTRETNQMNYKMFSENQAFQKEMWNLQNAYNDPAAQKARLRNAGFSPYLLAGTPQMGGVSSSLPQGGMQSATTGNPMQPIPFGDLGNIAANVAALAQAKKDAAQAQRTEKETQYVDQLNEATIKQLVASGQMSKASAEKIMQEREFFDANWDSMQKSLEKGLYKTSEEADLVHIQKTLLNEFGWQKWNADTQKAINEAALALLKGETEKATQSLMKVQEDSERVHQVVEKLVGQSQASANYSQAEFTRMQSAYQKMYNSVYEIFGKPQAVIDFLNYYYSLQGQKEAVVKAKLDNYIAKRTKHSGLFGQHMRNILGWLPFMTVPIAAGASNMPAPAPKPVVGFK